MKFVSSDAFFYSGVEDRTFKDRENGQTVSYFRYTFIQDGPEGSAVSFGSDKPLLSQGFSQFDPCYPEIDVTFGQQGAKVRLAHIYSPNDKD